MIGKLNPLQVVVMVILESAIFTANAYIGYKLLHAVDIGGAIFIHAFGAYFGLALAFTMRNRNFRLAAALEGSRYDSDVWAMIGTILLWIFWPSFNAVLAEGEGFQRAVTNTFISLCASTVSTFIVSSLASAYVF